MGVRVKFYSLFRLNLKSPGTEYEPEQPVPLAKILEWLDRDYDGYFSDKLLAEGAVKPGSIILINGKNIAHLDNLQTVVRDGDEISIFPPSAGG